MVVLVLVSAELKTLSVYKTQCVVPEKIHTHPMEGHWKILVGGGS